MLMLAPARPRSANTQGSLAHRTMVNFLLLPQPSVKASKACFLVQAPLGGPSITAQGCPAKGQVAAAPGAAPTPRPHCWRGKSPNLPWLQRWTLAWLRSTPQEQRKWEGLCRWCSCCTDTGVQQSRQAKDTLSALSRG